MNAILFIFLFLLSEAKFKFFREQTVTYQIQNIDGVNRDLLTVD